MLKLSKERAYARMNKSDIEVAERELESLFSQAEEAGKEMTYQYVLEDVKTMALIIYWNGEQVELYRFNIEGHELKFQLKDLNEKQLNQLFRRLGENTFKHFMELGLNDYSRGDFLIQLDHEIKKLKGE